MPQLAVPAKPWSVTAGSEDYVAFKQLHAERKQMLKDHHTALKRLQEAQGSLKGAEEHEAGIVTENPVLAKQKERLERARITTAGWNAYVDQLKYELERIESEDLLSYDDVYIWGWDSKTTTVTSGRNGTTYHQVKVGGQRFGTGYQYCAEVENALRSKGAWRMGLGFIGLALASGATATGTVLVATDENLEGGEKAVAVAASLLGAALYAASYILFSSSADASDSASKAAGYGGSDSSEKARLGCNSVVAEWNGLRAQAARDAADRARKADDEATKKREKLMEEWITRELEERLKVVHPGGSTPK